jgi:hypothetical protein
MASAWRACPRLAKRPPGHGAARPVGAAHGTACAVGAVPGRRAVDVSRVADGGGDQPQRPQHAAQGNASSGPDRPRCPGLSPKRNGRVADAADPAIARLGRCLERRANERGAPRALTRLAPRFSLVSRAEDALDPVQRLRAITSMDGGDVAMRPCRLQALEAPPVTKHIDRECFLLRQIRRADELRVPHAVSPSEQSLDDPFGARRAEDAGMNIAVALPTLDRLLRLHCGAHFAVLAFLADLGFAARARQRLHRRGGFGSSHRSASPRVKPSALINSIACSRLSAARRSPVRAARYCLMMSSRAARLRSYESTMMCDMVPREPPASRDVVG